MGEDSLCPGWSVCLKGKTCLKELVLVFHVYPLVKWSIICRGGSKGKLLNGLCITKGKMCSVYCTVHCIECLCSRTWNFLEREPPGELEGYWFLQTILEDTGPYEVLLVGNVFCSIAWRNNSNFTTENDAEGETTKKGRIL